MTSEKDLETLRAELDKIDERLLDTLRVRLECCVQIAQYKQKHAIPMMQPHRIGYVQQRAAQYSATHNMNAKFLRHLYDLIIAESCRLEDLIIGEALAE